MRNLILIAVAAVAFCAVGIAHPNVLIAQDSVEEDLASDRPVARNRPDRGEDVRDRRETFRDRGEDVSDRRGNRRAHQRDFRAHRGVRGDHKRYYSSRPDRRNRYFAKRHRYTHSARSYRGGGWGKAHRR